MNQEMRNSPALFMEVHERLLSRAAKLCAGPEGPSILG
jgi:hypothetical protein